MKLYKDKRDAMLDDLYQFEFDYGGTAPCLLTFQDLCIFMRQKRGSRERELRSMIDGDRADSWTRREERAA
jgi:hypothetical protein